MTATEQARKLANQAAKNAMRGLAAQIAGIDAQDLAQRALDGVFGLIEEQIAWKKISPCSAAAYHRVMYEQLPRIRWIARIHHRRMARKWRARCHAKHPECVGRI